MIKGKRAEARYFQASIYNCSLYSVSKQPNKPEYLALEPINSGKPTTSSIINKILSNQNIIVTDLKLKELLKIKGIEIDLPITTPSGLLPDFLHFIFFTSQKPTGACLMQGGSFQLTSACLLLGECP